ncbi:MAG TPA: OsmC family protein [Flavobacteriaceae bacterium]|nr:OsmC family protein [Flavobacteriaceae bacterium]MCB9213189.1 OsmC family protein [Alteromonas sp.]HPF10139.1 OsmC family protein [Flavobacteriaceae bacterium]HQU22573.1 OsmC family protein [Flavobacteriaceae bacterium]HQU65776.1 OsmC family protein [Flavobacteriaceae bacterium]
MKFTRKASAQWKGSGKEGKGTLTTASTVLNNTAYSFSTRFENEKGTNPEELIGAAHAGCFAMQLSFLLNEAGYTADTLDVSATVLFEDGNITTVTLDLQGSVPNISETEFNTIANKAKEICPISKVLKAEKVLNITLN